MNGFYVFTMFHFDNVCQAIKGHFSTILFSSVDQLLRLLAQPHSIVSSIEFVSCTVFFIDSFVSKKFICFSTRRKKMFFTIFFNTHLNATINFFCILYSLIFTIFPVFVSHEIFFKIPGNYAIHVLSDLLNQNKNSIEKAELITDFFFSEAQKIKVCTRQRFEQQYHNFTRVHSNLYGEKV